MLGVAIVGTGWGTRIQIPAFRKSGKINVNAIWARTQSKAEQAAKESNVPFGSADIKEILQRDDVQLVSLVTPPNTHCELVLLALKEGKHVLCEKPTALNAKEAEIMLQASKQFPQQLCIVDHELRFLSTMKKARELAQEKCGGIFFFEAYMQTGSRLPPKEWNWWYSKELGGGVLGAAGSHLIDALCWITKQRVESVCAILQTFIKERKDVTTNTMLPVTSDDYCSMQLKLTGGIVGTLHAVAVKAGPLVHRLSFSGPKGTMVLDGATLLFTPAATSSTEIKTEVLEDDTPLLDKQGPLKDIYGLGTFLIGQALASALLDGKMEALNNAATLEEALHTQRVLDAARESTEKGTWIKLT